MSHVSAPIRYARGVTYNFDPERWYEMRRSELGARRDRGELAPEEYESEIADLDRRIEEMVSRLDGSYEIPEPPR